MSSGELVALELVEMAMLVAGIAERLPYECGTSAAVVVVDVFGTLDCVRSMYSCLVAVSLSYLYWRRSCYWRLILLRVYHRNY